MESRQEMTFENGNFLSCEKQTPGFFENIQETSLS